MLLRTPRCAGYGVQSPSAYNFLRKVVRDRRHYDAYNELALKWKEDECGRARHRFYMRLAAHFQPENWLVTARTPIVEDYVMAGCAATSVVADCEKPDVMLIDMADDNDGDDAYIYNKVLARLNVATVLIVENIRNDRKKLDSWRKIIGDDRTGMCFDLFDFGLAFPRKVGQKQCYNVMAPHA